MSPRLQSILDLILAFFVALLLFGGVVWGVVTLVQVKQDSGAAVSFLNSEAPGFKLLNSAVASQAQQAASATTTAAPAAK